MFCDRSVPNFRRKSLQRECPRLLLCGIQGLVNQDMFDGDVDLMECININQKLRKGIKTSMQTF